MVGGYSKPVARMLANVFIALFDIKKERDSCIKEDSSGCQLNPLTDLFYMAKVTLFQDQDNDMAKKYHTTLAATATLVEATYKELRQSMAESPRWSFSYDSACVAAVAKYTFSN